MPAYMLSIIQVTRPDANFKLYIERAAALSAKFGGEYVIRGKPAAVYEGKAFEGKSVVVSRFPDMAQLKAFYEGEEYQQQLKPLRAGSGMYDIGAWESA
jgi:uncharacterized protein (DUF1330 family)